MMIKSLLMILKQKSKVEYQVCNLSLKKYDGLVDCLQWGVEVTIICNKNLEDLLGYFRSSKTS